MTNHPNVQLASGKEDYRVALARYHLKEGRGAVNLRVILGDLLAAYDETHPGRPDQPGMVAEMDREVLHHLAQVAEGKYDVPEGTGERIEVKLTVPLVGRMVEGGDMDYVPAAVWPNLAGVPFCVTNEDKPYISLRYVGGGHHRVSAPDRIK